MAPSSLAIEGPDCAAQHCRRTVDALQVDRPAPAVVVAQVARGDAPEMVQPDAQAAVIGARPPFGFQKVHFIGLDDAAQGQLPVVPDPDENAVAPAKAGVPVHEKIRVAECALCAQRLQ